MASSQSRHVSEGHVHSSSCTPDTCFREQMRAMRSRADTIFATPKMAPGVSFYETTTAEVARKMVSDAAARGKEIRPKHPTYDAKPAGGSLTRRQVF